MRNRDADDTNLLEETVEVLKAHGRTPSNVRWVGSKSAYCTWEDFEEIAKDTNYDAGFGGAEVVRDLVVVGDDFWLERHEYDGSEWWEFKTRPQTPAVRVKPRTLVRVWPGLDEFGGDSL